MPVVILLVLLVPGLGGAWEEPGSVASPWAGWNGGSAGWQARWCWACSETAGHGPLFLTGDIL
jgi:hypothetical protein